MKNKIFVAIICMMAFPFPRVYGQISNEVLIPDIGWPGAPIFEGLIVNQEQQSFTTIAHPYGDLSTCSLFTFDKSGAKTNEIRKLGRGAVKLEEYNGTYYIYHFPEQLTQGNRTGMAFTMVKPDGELKSIFVGEPDTEFLGFFKGISVFRDMGYAFIYQDDLLKDTIIDKRLSSGHHTFLLDSSKILSVVGDSIFSFESSGVIRSEYFKNADSIRSIERSPNGMIWLNAGDSVFELNQQLHVVSVFSLNLPSNTIASDLNIRGNHIYATIIKILPNGNLSNVVVSMVAYNYKFSKEWTTDLTGLYLNIKDLHEIGEHLLIAGRQNSNFGFIKSFELKTGKMTHPMVSFDVLSARASKGLGNRANLELKVQNLSLDTIKSLHFQQGTSFGANYYISSFTKMDGFAIAPGYTDWVKVGEISTPYPDDRSALILESVMVGMPNGHTSANGTQYMSGKWWWMDMDDQSNSDLIIEIIPNGFTIRNQEDITTSHIQITDLNGREISVYHTVNSGSFQLTTGVYLLVYEDKNHQQVKKFVVQ